ncbi:uncharacterized protein LOC119666752, partial [Teleopsis dalmanni]|uniref:uncharacterized protein LOC119666752 n=1 Tax=Teleopsis dalmanni TaxID=139649 RepID=UPI0018CEE38C
MKYFCLINYFPFMVNIQMVISFNCKEILGDENVKFLEWAAMEPCVDEVNNEELSQNLSENIWRLVKLNFVSIELIPPNVYQKLGQVLTSISTEELRNVTMARFETVEAFGAIQHTLITIGFKEEQLKVLAQKLRNEWIGKNPETYSEYDLIAMGEIICYLNTTDIDAIHADAFKEAVQWIGQLKNCPHDRLEAFAKLSKQSNSFGDPQNWSKLDVILLGNVINGLTSSDIALIDSNKLNLNRYYIQNSN